jgi:hypothetical protein
MERMTYEEGHSDRHESDEDTGRNISLIIIIFSGDRRTGNHFKLPPELQNFSVPYVMATSGSFPGVKAVGTFS